MNATVKTQLALRRRGEGWRERKKQEKTGHVNHEPGSEFFKMMLAKLNSCEMWVFFLFPMLLLLDKGCRVGWERVRSHKIVVL